VNKTVHSELISASNVSIGMSLSVQVDKATGNAPWSVTILEHVVNMTFAVDLLRHIAIRVSRRPDWPNRILSDLLSRLDTVDRFDLHRLLAAPLSFMSA
jgi:hypothetical protein